MVTEIHPVMGEARLQIYVDREAAKAIIAQLNKAEDVDLQDIAWNIDTALKRWLPEGDTP